jgi:excisionase family DNA binding protein
MTVAEVAAFLNVSERTVWRMLADGELPKVFIRRALRIPRDAVEALTNTAA